MPKSVVYFQKRHLTIIWNFVDVAEMRHFLKIKTLNP